MVRHHSTSLTRVLLAGVTHLTIMTVYTVLPVIDGIEDSSSFDNLEDAITAARTWLTDSELLDISVYSVDDTPDAVTDEMKPIITTHFTRDQLVALPR